MPMVSTTSADDQEEEEEEPTETVVVLKQRTARGTRGGKQVRQRHQERIATLHASFFEDAARVAHIDPG